MASTPRELAHHILLTAEKDTSRYVDDILSDAFSKYQPEKQDKAWIMEVVYGISRMRLKLDLMISHFFKGRYHKSQHALKILLRLGAYQLKFMSTPEHAAINETVKLSRKVGQGRSSSLINAVLRQISIMEGDDAICSDLNEIQHLAFQTSHPAWMLERWGENFGRGATDQLCQYNNRSPNTWIRRNDQKAAHEDFVQLLGQHNIEYSRSKVLDTFYRIDSAAGLIQTNEFNSGWFSFQDLAAGIVASLVTPKAGESVLDACSAPGGKMAAIMEQHGHDIETMFALDASSQRLGKVKQTVQRLDLNSVLIEHKDASVDTLPRTNWTLIDVPCSGTGVLSRRPDARWKKQPGDIDSLHEIQLKILMNSWKHLQKDGSMIYATCSLEPEENWELVHEAIPKLKDAKIEPILDENLQPYVDERGALSTLPWRDEMDGMFAVKLRKIS